MEDKEAVQQKMQSQMEEQEETQYVKEIVTGHSSKNSGGGAGNKGGIGWASSGYNYEGNENASTNGGNGTGGLLIIYTNDLYNSGSITAEGVNGGQAIERDHDTSGGSSGGGSINIFAKIISEARNTISKRRRN